jgi:UDP-glucose 4-epimerase
MKILITGGAGFIGSHLAELHLAQGDEVYVVDNLSGGSQDNIKHWLTNENFHFFKANLLNWPELENILSQVDRVYHLAAILGMFRVLADPVFTIEENIKTTECILDIIKNLAHKPLLIIASSSEVYGDQAGLLDEDMPLIVESTSKNHSNYPISKICNESMGLAFYHEYGVPIIIVRLFNTIGPRQTGRYGMVVPRFIKQALANEPITIFADGTQTRSFCDVRDTVNLLNLVANNNASIGHIINVGNNELVTINQLASLVKSITKSKSEIIYIPYAEVYHGGYIGIKERQIDVTKLLTYTNYQYQWRLVDTITYMAQQYHEKI